MLKRALSTSVLLAALPLLAQGGPGPMEHGRMGFGPGGFGMRSAVTNAPYSATYTSTSTEKLQDGTVLTHTGTRTVTRDSLGRTREDITMPARGNTGTTHTMIVIMDPVARTVTQLRPDEKVAVVHGLPQPGQGQAHRGGSSPDSTNAAASTPHVRPNEVQSDLGSKTISGVVATGKRTTHTIPAGEMGNATPLVSTRETWYSPDLKIEMGSSEVDPFHGTRTTTVSSLTKTEPDAALFQVPAGYTLQQAPQRAFVRRGPGGTQNNSTPAPPPGA